MIASVIDLGSMPSICISWVNHTACSSPVRMAEVCWRHSPTIWSPSTTPNLMLVLLTLIASSMARSPLGRAGQQLSGNDPAWTLGGIEQQGALAVHPRKAAADQLLAQLHVDLEAERACLGQPFRADRREAVAPPFCQPSRQCHGQPLEGRFDRAAEAGSAVTHLG